MERTPSLPKKEDSLQREEKSQFLSDLVIKIEKSRKASRIRHWGEASGGTTTWEKSQGRLTSTWGLVSERWGYITSKDGKPVHDDTMII